MTKLGLLVTLEAKAGKEMQLANFLTGALPLIEAEPETTAWFAIQMGPSTFGIFDAFADERGRGAHLSGEVAKALMAKRARISWPSRRRSKRWTFWRTSSQRPAVAPAERRWRAGAPRSAEIPLAQHESGGAMLRGLSPGGRRRHICGRIRRNSPCGGV